MVYSTIPSGLIFTFLRESVPLKSSARRLDKIGKLFTLFRTVLQKSAALPTVCVCVGDFPAKILNSAYNWRSCMFCHDNECNSLTDFSAFEGAVFSHPPEPIFFANVPKRISHRNPQGQFRERGSFSYT